MGPADISHFPRLERSAVLPSFANLIIEVILTSFPDPPRFIDCSFSCCPLVLSKLFWYVLIHLYTYLSSLECPLEVIDVYF